MGTIDPSVLGDLLQYGPPGLLFAIALFRGSWIVFLIKRLDRATTEKEAAVAAERKRIAADDKRKDRRIDQLAAENERLEQELDKERARRRAAEDGRAS